MVTTVPSYYKAWIVFEALEHDIGCLSSSQCPTRFLRHETHTAMLMLVPLSAPRVNAPGGRTDPESILRTHSLHVFSYFFNACS
jgi:hypothetical protein